MLINAGNIIPIEARDYEQLIMDFRTCFEKQCWVLSIGKFGEISYPGISDIDLIVVTQPERLAEAEMKFQEWVSQTKNASFCFYHPPLFINENIINIAPYLHSLENINWLTHSSHHFYSNANNQILVLAWTMFLIPIVIKLLNENISIGIRESLLILKNLHNSHALLSNCLQKKSIALQDSDKLRKQYTTLDTTNARATKQMTDNIVTSYSDTLKNIFILLDQYAEQYLKHLKTSFTGSYSISKDMVLKPSLSCAYKKNGERSVLYLKPELINLFLKPSCWKKDKLMLIYVKNLEIAFFEYKKEKVRMQFVMPFSYPIFMRTNLIFKIKKHLQLIKYHKSFA